MSSRIQPVHDPVSVKPLLRSIAREIRERRERIQILEARMEALGHAPGRTHDELLELRAELAEHRRGLRLANKELEELGWTLQEGETPMLVMPTGGGIERLSWEPDKTGYYPNAFGAELQ